MQELLNKVISSWDEAAARGLMTVENKDMHMDIFLRAASGEDVTDDLVQLADHIEYTGSEYERAATGIFVGSYEYWSGQSDKIGVLESFLIGWAVDVSAAAVGNLIFPGFGTIIGPLCSLGVAFAAAEPSNPEFSWGGVGHWGCHHKEIR